MTKAGEKLGHYAFLVDMRANKIEIRQAVEKTYGVTVKEVRTMIHKGKNRSRWTRIGLQRGRKAAFKKAVVTLKQGDKIDFYASV